MPIHDVVQSYSLCHLPEHLAAVGQHTKAFQLLTNFDFQMLRCQLDDRFLEHNTEDMDRILSLGTRSRLTLNQQDKLRIWNAFFRTYQHILRRGNDKWPAFKILLQLAAEHADDSPVTKAAEKWFEEGQCDWLWLRLRNRPSEVPATPCLQTFEGPEMASFAIHPDGKRVIIGGRRTLSVLNIETGICIQTIVAHTDWVRAIAIHPDGCRVISAGDSRIRVWDIESGACIRMLEGHNCEVYAVVIHPDGRRAVSGSGDCTVRTWDLDSGSCLRTMKGDRRMVTALAITENGQRVISVGEPAMIQSWDLESGKLLHATDQSTRNWDTIVAIHPDGRHAIWADYLGPLRLRNIQTAEVLRTLEGHTQAVTSVAIHPNGRILLSGSDDKTLKLWNLDTGICTKTIEIPEGWNFEVAFHQDGLRAISISGDNTLRLWDLSTEDRDAGSTHTEYHEIVSAAIHPNGRDAISAYIGKSPTLWTLAGGRCIRSLDIDEHDCVEAIAVDRKGNRALMACGHHSVTLKLVDLESGNCIQVCNGHLGRVSALAIYPNGCQAISASDHFSGLKFWDLLSGEFLRSLDTQQTVVAMTVHPDARHVIVGTYDGSIEMWAMEGHLRPRRVRVFHGPGDPIAAVALDRDGKRLACARRKSIYLWEVDTGSPLACWEGEGRWIKTCSLPPEDQNQIIAVDRTGAVFWLNLME